MGILELLQTKYSTLRQVVNIAKPYKYERKLKPNLHNTLNKLKAT